MMQSYTCTYACIRSRNKLVNAVRTQNTWENNNTISITLNCYRIYVPAKCPKRISTCGGFGTSGMCLWSVFHPQIVASFTDCISIGQMRNWHYPDLFWVCLFLTCFGMVKWGMWCFSVCFIWLLPCSLVRLLLPLVCGKHFRINWFSANRWCKHIWYTTDSMQQATSMMI